MTVSTPTSSRLARRRRRAGLLLSLPAVIIVVALLGIPIGQAVYYSMTTWDGITSTWIGPGRDCKNNGVTPVTGRADDPSEEVSP